MRVSLKELLEKLGISHVLSPYETFPWSHYDSESGLTCSAEVRMGMDGDEVEGEIQMMHDNPAPGTPPMEPVCYMKAAPSGEDWIVATVRIRNEPVDEEIYNWQEKTCNFFQAVTEYLIRQEMPDIEKLLEEHFYKEKGADQYGSGGGKSPKIRPEQVLGIQKGKGM